MGRDRLVLPALCVDKGKSEEFHPVVQPLDMQQIASSCYPGQELPVALPNLTRHQMAVYLQEHLHAFFSQGSS